MTVDPSARAFESKTPVSAEELLSLRQRLWADGAISRAEAEELFARNASATPSREWTDFFIEALCGYLIEISEPRGYVNNEAADWLIRCIQRNGEGATQTDIELIVKLLERADFAPDSLKQFALAKIEKAILGTTGTARIDDAAVSLLRRLIFAPAGDGPAKVSTPEAEMLFRLKDATLGAQNSPEWKKLFVQGVANHLVAHQSYEAPAPGAQMRLEAPYASDPFGHVLSKLGHDIAGGDEILGAVRGDRDENRNQAFDRAVAADAAVTGSDAAWLKRLFERDGARDELEQALVDFLAEDGFRGI
jgi:hypothetical protein